MTKTPGNLDWVTVAPEPTPAKRGPYVASESLIEMAKPNPLQFLLSLMGRVSGRRPGLVLAVFLVLTAVAIPFATRTVHPDNVEKDLLKVLTGGLPRAEAYKRIARDFGVIDRHFVLLELQDPKDLPAAKGLADAIAERMRAEAQMVRSAHSRLPLREFLLKHAHLYLDDRAGKLLAARLTDEAIGKSMKYNRELLRVSPEMKQRVLLDPLGLFEVLREVALQREGGESSPVDSEGYMVSPDGRMLLVSISPSRPAAQGEEAGFTTRLLKLTEEAIAEARTERFNGEPALSARIKTEVGGSYAQLHEGGRLIVSGIIWSALTSFVGVLLLFALAYRRPAALVFIGLPLAIAVLWTLALVPVGLPEYGGRLSAVGGAFAAVLLGLGIDYAVHIYNRFAAERAAGSTPEEAAERSVITTGEGIFYGALTTIIAFLGMTVSNFRVFREFGRLAALGVFLTVLLLLMGLPAALTLLARLRGSKQRTPKPFSFGLGTAATAIRRRPGWLLIAGVLLLGVSVAAMFPRPGNPQWGVWFELDLGKLGPPHHMEKVGEINRRVARAFNIDYREVSVIVRGKSSEEALERTAELYRRARSCDLVKSVRGILDLVPPQAAQRESIKVVKDLNLEGLPARLDRAGVAAGFRPGAFLKCRFSEVVRSMGQRAREEGRLDPAELKLMADRNPTLAAVRELAGYVYRPPSGNETMYRTHTLLSVIRGYSGEDGKGLKSRDYARMARELGVDGSRASMTGYVLVVYELKDSIKDDLLTMLLLVAGSVLVMLFVALRNPLYVLQAISPVLIGGSCMLFAMKLTGLTLNYVNMLAIPVLIGIGVDNAVHLIIRYRQEGRDACAAVTETGRALVLCSLTTILGFMSLLACPHWALKSLGIVVSIGMAFVLLASIFFVPAGLEMLSERRRRHDMVDD